MEHEFTMVLIWAIIVTITLGFLAILIVKLRQKHDKDIMKMEQRISDERKDAVETSRNVLKGKIGEQMSPLLPEFYSKYEPADARFIGSPIDYVIFKNMSKRAAELLRDDLEAKGPVRVSDVEVAQREILTVARKMADNGDIVLGGGGDQMI